MTREERPQDIIRRAQNSSPATHERIRLLGRSRIHSQITAKHSGPYSTTMTSARRSQCLRDQTSFGRRLIDLLDRRGITTVEAMPGQQIEFAGKTNLVLDVLWPPAVGLPDDYRHDPNSTSIVIRARYGEAAFLFTGDINVEQELDLVRNPCPFGPLPCELRADVLKVAHQGSRFSSSMLFLESVRPTLAILSAGATAYPTGPSAR